MNDIKRWLQIVGGGVMLAEILGGRQFHYQPSPKMFLVGALVFLSSFITWKAKKSDDNDD
jgi:hypothetical protein